jgi:iron complex transport system ATP-binding protein
MILQTDNLTLEYPGKLLCRNLSLTIHAGECWAILGQNGCGKTTLLHALGGLHCVGAGEPSSIMVAGKASRAWDRRDLARYLGILLQEETGDFWGNVYEYVLLGRHPHLNNMFGFRDVDYEMTIRAMERMELMGVAKRSLVTLSGGERQRARIALLLAQSPQCLLLDEPLQHLDLRHQVGVMALFRELARQGKALVMVLHDIGWASHFCDHVLMLFDDGHTIAGPVETVLKRDNLEALYRCGMTELPMGRRCHFMPDLTPSV